MSGHTPGPWELGKTDDDDVAFVVGPDGIDTAVTFTGGAREGHEDYANARLIAAAPDLLEALEGCLPDLKHYVSTHGPGPDRRLESALVAIAKAKPEVSS